MSNTLPFPEAQNLANTPPSGNLRNFLEWPTPKPGLRTNARLGWLIGALVNKTCGEDPTQKDGPEIYVLFLK
jgi:hypothetical protein